MNAPCKLAQISMTNGIHTRAPFFPCRSCCKPSSHTATIKNVKTCGRVSQCRLDVATARMHHTQRRQHPAAFAQGPPQHHDKRRRDHQGSHQHHPVQPHPAFRQRKDNLRQPFVGRQFHPKHRMREQICQRNFAGVQDIPTDGQVPPQVPVDVHHLRSQANGAQKSPDPQHIFQAGQHVCRQPLEVPVFHWLASPRFNSSGRTARDRR